MPDLINKTSNEPVQASIKKEIRTAASVVDFTRNNEGDKPINKKVAVATTQNTLDNVQALDPRSFPNPPIAGSNHILATIANMQYLLDSYGIVVRYNIIRKKLSIMLPGYSGTPDNADNVAIAQIISLATLNGLAKQVKYPVISKSWVIVINTIPLLIGSLVNHGITKIG